MMSEVFVISDTHFGHSATFDTFKRKCGAPLRPFKSLEDMHNTMIENWNRAVGEDDLVIHLGDVAFSGQAYDSILPQLNGRKYLVRGNHDRFSEGRYRRHFKRVLGCYVRDRHIFTHIPIHPNCTARWVQNIHGHLHGNTLPDPFYFNACVEQINYTPVNFEEIKK